MFKGNTKTAEKYLDGQENMKQYQIKIYGR